MSTVETPTASAGGLLASILSEESFRPAEPRNIEETGLTATIIENLIVKYVSLIGSASGRKPSMLPIAKRASAGTLAAAIVAAAANRSWPTNAFASLSSTM